MEAGLDVPLTHDNLFHTVLGLMDVGNSTYKPALDALASCRNKA
jgi:lipid A ethanolaminephosphotransferase